MSDTKNMKLFSLSSNHEIAQKIADAAGVPLGKVSSRQFSDGEIQVNIEESVRGYDVYIIQSTSYPVNNHLMELLIMVDACVRASANTINVVLPYFGYARQDRIASSREPLTAKLVANMLVKAGVSRVLTLDLHAVQVQGFFDIPVDNLYTIPLFAKHYCDKGLTGSDVVVVSPKNSGVKRARSLAEYLDAPIAIIDYAQDDSERSQGYIIGEVEGKKAILIDDILNTGRTFSEAAKILERDGATEIYAVSSHGLFVNGAAELLDATNIKEILVTDSVLTESRKPKNVQYITASELIGDAMVRIHERKPVSPLFKQKLGEFLIYLDNAATTPMSSVAISAMTQVMQETYGNPSSIHGHGRQAGKLLREARQELASLLGTKPQHIFFTTGGTESNNTAIIGYCLRHQNRGKHIITTAIEHHAVLEPIKYLVENFGFEVTILQPEHQEITADQVKNALREDTILVSTMFANNETGTLLPIAEIGEVLKNHPAVYHVDAVQVVGKLEILPEKLGIDFLSASAHKFYGPKGVGFLYAASTDFDSYLHGGDQEQKKRAGTENLPAIVGMVAALKDDLENQAQNFEKVQQLKDTFLKEMAEADYYLNQGKDQLPYVLNIGFPGQRNDLLLLRLDLEGISISTGSACTAGVVQVSHVLQAFYGEGSPRLHESVRVSISPQNTEQEIITLAQTLKEIIGG